MRVQDLVNAIESIAPLNYAEPWDNVGLLIGDSARDLRGPVLLTIDLTEAVIDEAARRSCDAVIAYHPPIFHALKRIGTASGRERIVLRAIEAGLAVYSPHTALDAAPGGMTDWLADGVLDPAAGAGADRRALAPHTLLPVTQQVKIVTFVPAGEVEQVRSALASAGAGLIGDYELCSFMVRGTGTFRGKAGTKPAVGQAERFEQVDEVRVEMVCSKKALPIAIETLREFHPYEEAPVDVYELLGRPIRSSGAGRRLVLDQPATLEQLCARVKKHIGVGAVKLAAAGDEPITRVGLCPGAGAELAAAAAADGCQLFITGEMRYHEVVAALDSGMSIMLAGHTPTERGFLPRLAERLGGLLSPIRFSVADSDRSPMAIL